MLRVPPKNLHEYSWFSRLLFYFQKKKYGSVLEPILLWARSPSLMKSFLKMGKQFNRKDSPLDPVLRALICVRVSQINGCEFCIDLNSFLVLERGGSLEKINELQNIDKSSFFSEKEKVALKFAELVTRSSQTIDDHFFQKLREHFSDDAIVELTALIAFQNMSSKFNTALGTSTSELCLSKRKPRSK